MIHLISLWTVIDPAQKKRSSQESVESVLKEEQSLWWVGFMKEVGFKPEVKEWGSYGYGGGDWRSDRCRKR